MATFLDCQLECTYEMQQCDSVDAALAVTHVQEMLTSEPSTNCRNADGNSMDLKSGGTVLVKANLTRKATVLLVFFLVKLFR